jgi:hypothetical protein
MSGEKIAFELYQQLETLFQPHKPVSPYLAQVQFHTFALPITEHEIIFTHRLGFVNQLGHGRPRTMAEILKAQAEVRCLLTEAPSFRFTKGTDEQIFSTSTGVLMRDSTPKFSGRDRDAWMVRFPASLNSEIEEFLEVLYREAAKTKRAIAALSSGSISEPQDSLARQIGDLHALVESGALSQEEFQVAKRKLLR